MDLEMEMNNMDFDMHLFDMDPDMDEDMDLPVLIEFNRQSIIELLNEVTFDDDPYIVKQYFKLIIFLAYMKNQDLFQFNKPELIKKINIMRNFIKFKLFYFNNYYVDYSHVKSVDKTILNTLSTSFTNSQTNKNSTIYNDFDLFSKSLFSNNKNSSRISCNLYNKILTIYNTEKNIEEVKNIIHKINLSTQLDIIGVQYSKLNKKPQSNINDLNYKVKEIDNFQKNIVDILKKTEKLKYNYEKLQNYKSTEKKREYERQFCKNTLLLNVDLMKKRLNSDIINNIRSFVGEDILEEIRIGDIQGKYFKKPREILKNMLNGWKRKHLCNYIKDHYYMMFSFDGVQSSVYDYDGEDFMEYFYFHEIEELYYMKSLPITNVIDSKKNYINDILNTNNIAYYYNFQKDIYILSKILKQNKTR
jgi:uncharacterized protein YoxC